MKFVPACLGCLTLSRETLGINDLIILIIILIVRRDNGLFFDLQYVQYLVIERLLSVL